MSDIENGLLLNTGTTLRCGDWREVLADVECDALICDPPYGERTHRGHDSATERVDDKIMKQKICYSFMIPDEVRECAAAWVDRVRGWIAVMSCSDLASIWREALDTRERYSFAPVICINKTPPPRVSGDGPTSAAIYLTLSRPRHRPYSAWGHRPGYYEYRREPGTHIGGKTVTLMSAIIRDYSRPGDLVCDPFSGGGTTAIACESLGRRFIGAEIDPEAHAKAIKRIAAGVQLDMFGGTA